MIHGSPIQGLKILLPKFSRFRKIFGTTDEQIAARYMADGDSHRLIDSIRFLLNSDGKKLLNQKGSIYTLSPRDFKLDPHKGKLDWVYSTDRPQRVLYERKFDSVLQELNNRHIISVPPKYSKAFLQKDVSPTLLKDLIENQTYMLKQGNKSMGKFFELYKEADFMVSDKNNNEKYVNSYGVYIGTSNDPEVAKGKFNALMKKHKKLSIARKEYEKENPDDYVTAAGKYGPKNDKLKVKVRIGKIDSDGQKEFYKELFKTASKKEENKPSPVADKVVDIGKPMKKLAEVIQEGDVFKVYSKKGKLFGTYKTEAEARKRMRQMEAFKHMKKIAESNIAIDLLSGADPTGRATLEISKGNKKNSLLRGTAAAIGGFTAGSLATNAITGGGLILAGKLTKNPQLKKILDSSGRSMLLLFNPKKTIKTLKQFNEAQKLVTKDIKAFKNLKNLYSKYEPTISHIKANSLTAIDDIPVNKILADKSKIKTMGKSLEKQFKASNEFERKYGKTHGVAFSDGAGLIAGLASSGIGGAMNAISAGSQYQAGQQYRKDIAKIKAK